MLSPLERYCINVGSDESRLNVSQSHKTVSTNHSFRGERIAEEESPEPRSFGLITSLPSGLTVDQMFTSYFFFFVSSRSPVQNKKGVGGVRF